MVSIARSSTLRAGLTALAFAFISVGIIACPEDPDDTDPLADAGSGDFGGPNDDSSVFTDPDTPAGDILCRSCQISLQCGGNGNECLVLPSGESVCAVNCIDDQDGCPEGFFCVDVVGDGTIMQCVPELLYCVDPCETVECAEDEVCDTFTGECADLRGLCDECENDSQCGEDSYCLTFPDGDRTTGCGQNCVGGEACPSGYLCASINEEGTIRQCVPDILTCVDRCATSNCPDTRVCDPLTGDCVVPRGLCEGCIASFQCGFENDLCLGFSDGTSACTRQCGQGSANPEGCPPGYVCFDVGGGDSQCVPPELTCTDHCSDPVDVSCDDGFNCDPIDGTCHASQLDLCGRPCEEHYECGGQNDYCVTINDGAVRFCGRDCSDDVPCPVGYECYELTDNSTQQCGPNREDIALSCELCDSTVCPEGHSCRPWDGSCLPDPSPCSAQDTDCPDGELCNTIDNRCEPVGLTCRYGSFFDCGSNQRCSATSLGQEGVCLPECEPGGVCPDHRPLCASFARITASVCVEIGLGGPEQCGHLASSTTEVGRPCPGQADDDLCPTNAPICLEGVAAGVPGICTQVCSPMDVNPCPAGGSCARVAGSDEHYCLPDTCDCLVEPDLEVGELDMLAVALSQIGLSRCDLAYTRSEREAGGALLTNDPFALELPNRVRNDVLYGRDVLASVLDNISVETPLASALRLGAGLVDLGVAEPVKPTFGDPDLCTAITSIFESMGDEAPDCETSGINAADAEFPDLGALVSGIAWAADQRDGIVGGIDGDAFDDLLFDLTDLLPRGGALELGTDTSAIYANRELLLNIKLVGLYDVSAALAQHIEELALDDTIDVTTELEIITPLGAIVLRGDADDVYCRGENCSEGDTALPAPVLLLVDTGGNDTYLVPAGATDGYEEPVSVFIDLGGDDVYAYSETDAGSGFLLPDDGSGRDADLSLSVTGRQGSSRGGIGFLIDLGGGSDTYRSLRFSQGFGVLGVGALYDDGCTTDLEDTACDGLESESYSQGVGFFGLGVVVLGDGPTDLTGLHAVQGVGLPGGAGISLDLGGDDHYLAHPGAPRDVLVTPPVLSSLGNLSAAQGTGVGFPSADPDFGGNVSGGVGVLLDLDGNDRYDAGLFAQGSAYWHGLGVFTEAGQGDDIYEALAGAQGFALDYGAAVFGELGGDDQYNQNAPEPTRRVLGSGENFGAGLFIEQAGSDMYATGSQALGAGYLNGTGVFVDLNGQDSYLAESESTLGDANLPLTGRTPGNPRLQARTVGVFVDAAGNNDVYDGRSLDSPTIGNDWTWVQQTQLGADEPELLEYGIGADGSGGTGLDLDFSR